jgi:hypothetical protein
VNDFDFVKLTLWLSCILTAVLGGGAAYCSNRATSVKAETDKIETNYCREIGRLAKDVKVLEEEKRNDKTPEQSDTTGIYTFFMSQAQRCQIDANADYTLKPREPQKHPNDGYVDQSFDVQFKKDRAKTRDRIVMFIYDCETQSRRIKLQQARITLVEDKATEDYWSADSLIFVRRDPMRTGT